MAEKNQIKIVRAVAKLSSLILNVDDITDQYAEEVPKKFLRDANKFIDWLHENTNELMIGLNGHNEEMTSEITGWFNDYSERYKVADSLSKEVTLFVSKGVSAVNDLKEIRIPEGLDKKSEEYELELSFALFAAHIFSRFENILNQGYFKTRLPCNTKDCEVLVRDMDAVGKKIMIEA